MEFPFNALVINNIVSCNAPNDIVPAFTVFEVTGRLGNTHTYYGRLNGDDSFILHITDMIFLKPETDPQLYRRAVKRKGVLVNQDYYTRDYNHLFHRQLHKFDEGLKFCMTSDDAMELAIFWETLDVSDYAIFSPISRRRRAGEYVCYAEILEKFEKVIDGYHAEEMQHQASLTKQLECN